MEVSARETRLKLPSMPEKSHMNTPNITRKDVQQPGKLILAFKSRTIAVGHS